MNVVCGNVFRDGLLWKRVGAGSLLYPVTIQKRPLNLPDAGTMSAGATDARCEQLVGHSDSGWRRKAVSLTPPVSGRGLAVVGLAVATPAECDVAGISG
jgi:hypothetical protein